MEPMEPASIPIIVAMSAVCLFRRAGVIRDTIDAGSTEILVTDRPQPLANSILGGPLTNVAQISVMLTNVPQILLHTFSSAVHTCISNFLRAFLRTYPVIVTIPLWVDR
jgi:hypothetical protein